MNKSTNILFIIWFFVSCSDATGSLLTCFLLWRRKTRTNFYLSLLLAGIAIESILAALSLIAFWPTEFQDATAFALFRIVGRTIKSIAVWMLVLYMLGLINGVRKRAAELREEHHLTFTNEVEDTAREARKP